jgi:sugar lactone lactonase YvrE
MKSYFFPFMIFVFIGCNLPLPEADISTTKNADPTFDSTEILGNVTTFAGKAVYAGDDGPLKDAGFGQPHGMVYDSQGNLFVADNSTIRKITPQGVVSTLAGSVNNSGSADGTGSAARFSILVGMAIDSNDNLFVTDLFNHTIRKITPAGVVTTISGTAGVDGSDDGIGSAARFLLPAGIAIDSNDNLFVADSFNHTIRKITPAGVVTTFAGTAGVSGSNDGTGTQSKFSSPRGIAINSSNELFVADESHKIRKITSAQVVSTFAGSGASGNHDATGTAATFNDPRGLAVDSSNNLYVADTSNNIIRKITTGGVVTTIAGQAGVGIGTLDGTGANARFYYPMSIVEDGSGNLIIGEPNIGLLRKVNSSGVVTTIAGPTKLYNGSGSVARFNRPAGMDIDSQRNIYVADYQSHTIRKITPAGVVSTFAGTEGITGSTDGTGTAAKFHTPFAVAVDSSDNVFVADFNNKVIRKITPAGVVSTFAGSTGVPGSDDGTGSVARFNGPIAIAVDGENNLYIADQFNYTIRKITPAGVVTTLAGTAGNYGYVDDTGPLAQFSMIYDLTVDQDGNIFATDYEEGSGEYSYIRKITPAGVVTTVAGGYNVNGFADGPGLSATFGFAYGIESDGAGNLYVTDYYFNSIRKLDSSFNVTTLAGSSSQATGRADGAGTNATFYYPSGIAFDPTGILYVSDFYNRTIRKID